MATTTHLLRLSMKSADRRRARAMGVRRLSTSLDDSKCKALIVGGGLSGVTLALALAKRGLKPRVIDHLRDANTFESLPTGVFLSTNAMQGFEALGVAEEIVRQGKAITSHVISHYKGRSTYGRVNYARFLNTLPVGIEYNKLLTILRNQLSTYGVSISYQTTISTIKEQPGAKQQIVRFTGAGAARGGSSFDLVVGADGDDSKVREMLFPANQFRTQLRSGQNELFHVVVPQAALLSDSDSLIEMWGEGGRFLIMPIGFDHMAITATQSALYGTHYVRHGVREWIEFKNRFYGRFEGLIAPMVMRGIEERAQDVYVRSPQMVRMKTWVNGRTVLIGNAAHALLGPHVQEAAMCVEDALVLAHLVSSIADTDVALDQYVNQRFQRVFNIQQHALQETISSRASTGWSTMTRGARMRISHCSLLLSQREKRMITSAPPQVLVKVE